ncbi:unnamed protein product, partial [Heterotrigona itama]
MKERVKSFHSLVILTETNKACKIVMDNFSFSSVIDVELIRKKTPNLTFEFTPVSSLVRSSTIITILLSGLIANFEIDFKEIITLSTLSSIRFRLRILSSRLNESAFFHASFKSIILYKRCSKFYK